MRVLIAPQEFKGVLSAAQTAEALRRGISRARPDVELDVVQLADGGRGTVDALVGALGGEVQLSRVQGPLSRQVTARWAKLPDRTTAVMEMSAASGLTLLSPTERDPRRTCTFGSGQLIAAALDAGCKRIIMGLGGSATNDGGAGAARALGIQLLSAQGESVPPGGAALAQLARIDVSQRDPRLDQVELIIATDVRNALVGPNGASAVYGPQKGATAAMVTELDAALAHYASVVEQQLGMNLAHQPGTGAAGGLAYGLAVFARGRITSGFELLSRVLELDRRVESADVVVTGEGRFDGQTAQGKGPGAIGELARSKGKRAVLFAGVVGADVGNAHAPFDEIITVGREGLSVEELRKMTASRVEAAAETWAKSLHA